MKRLEDLITECQKRKPDEDFVLLFVSPTWRAEIVNMSSHVMLVRALGRCGRAWRRSRDDR